MHIGIYNDIDVLWQDLIARCLTYGTMNHATKGSSKELIGCSFELTNVQRNFLTNPVRALPIYYPCAEFIWYLTFNGDIDFIAEYSKAYRKYDEGNGLAYGAYGSRLVDNPGFRWESREQGVDDQLSAVISLLQKRSSSRQCVIALWDSGDLIHAMNKSKKDLPCTQTIQFLVRDEKLHMIVNMRSNDIWLGVPNDVFCFSTLQILIAGILGIETGSYHHHVGSMHLYERNWDKAKEAVSTHDYGIATNREHGWRILPIVAKHAIGALFEFRKELINMELMGRQCRNDEEWIEHTRKTLDDLQPSIMRDLITACYTKTIPNFVPHTLSSPRMRAVTGLLVNP